VNKDQAKDDFATAKTMSDNGPESSWWVMHTPGVQVIYYGGKVHKGDKDVRHALGDATGFSLCGTGTAPKACKPSQFLLGHEHLCQSVVFPRSLQTSVTPNPAYPWIFPRMFITGHGGTQIVDSSPTPSGRGPACQYAFDDIQIPGLSADLHSIADTVTQHGYVAWTRNSGGASSDPSGWDPAFVWAGSATGQDANANRSSTTVQCMQ
jgi:hypothetical protein